MPQAVEHLLLDLDIVGEGSSRPSGLERRDHSSSSDATALVTPRHACASLFPPPTDFVFSHAKSPMRRRFKCR